MNLFPFFSIKKTSSHFYTGLVTSLSQSEEEINIDLRTVTMFWVNDILNLMTRKRNHLKAPFEQRNSMQKYDEKKLMWPPFPLECKAEGVRKTDIRENRKRSFERNEMCNNQINGQISNHRFIYSLLFMISTANINKPKNSYTFDIITHAVTLKDPRSKWQFWFVFFFHFHSKKKIVIFAPSNSFFFHQRRCN